MDEKKKLVALEYSLALVTLLTAGLTFYKVYVTYKDMNK